MCDESFLLSDSEQEVEVAPRSKTSRNKKTVNYIIDSDSDEDIWVSLYCTRLLDFWRVFIVGLVWVAVSLVCFYNLWLVYHWLFEGLDGKLE